MIGAAIIQTGSYRNHSGAAKMIGGRDNTDGFFIAIIQARLR